MRELGWIQGHHFTAGVVVLDGKVVGVAPILHYMIGWLKADVELYCWKRKWGLEWRRDPT